MTPAKMPASVDVLGVRINPLSVDQAINFIVHQAQSGKKSIAAYVNVYALNLAYEQPWFRAFLNQTDLTYCDGYGVIVGARLLGAQIPQRFTPPDWFPRLAAACAQQNLSLYLLGARPGVAQKCADQLCQAIPGLKIAGCGHGYFDKSLTSLENQAVIQVINAVHPDLLVVGMGMPTQERWLAENWDTIEADVALPVGALFDYLVGEVRRAPRWMTDHGLEWLGRLVVEPHRLWRRYILGNPLFLWRIFKQRLGLFTVERTS